MHQLGSQLRRQANDEPIQAGSIPRLLRLQSVQMIDRQIGQQYPLRRNGTRRIRISRQQGAVLRRRCRHVLEGVNNHALCVHQQEVGLRTLQLVNQPQ